jgi:hypothetical protein
MRIIGITALWLVLTTTLVAADGSKPDFSGTWIFSPAKSKLETTAPTKSIFVIEHQDPKFKLTRTHTWDEGSNTWTIDTTTDGKEHYQKKGEFESWTRMTWMGNELVLDMKVAYLGEEGTNVVHYQLADGGQSFIAAEWFHMPRKQHHNLWVFDRGLEE